MHQWTAMKMHKKIALSLALLLSCAPILSMPVKTFAAAVTSYYVDGTNGSDANNGLTTGAAFKTIQKAAEVAVSGDKVEIMEGVYRETVIPKSDGVTFQSYNGDKVTLSGGDLVTGWTPTTDAGIYSAPMSWDYQNGYGNIVYYTDSAGNDTSLSQARWPNIPDSLMFDKTKYAKFSSTGAISGSISNGGANLQMDNVALAAANPLPNSTSADAWKDALLVATAANGFVIYTGKVTGSSTTLNFEWPYTTGYLPKTASPGFGLYLTNSYQALLYDVANPITGVAGVPGVAAWYKDVANQKLYVAVPGGADPNTGKIEAKKREFAFDLAGRTGITISGINIRTAGVNFANSSNNMLKGATVEMVDSYNKPFAVDTTLAGFVSGLVLDGDHNTIRDSEVKNMFGFGIVIKGHDNNVINNHIHDFNRYGLYADGINVNGYNHLISHNSIHAGGRAAIGGAFTSSVIAYNDIYDVMKISYDGGIFYVVNSNFGSSEIHHNTVHDSPGEGIYFDNLSFDAVVYNNIIWNVSVGMLINTPNERMILLNNTVYKTNSQSYGTWGDSAADGIGSYGSVLMGNILENTGFESQASGGAYEQGNTIDTRTNLQAMFVDPDNKNFALKNPDSQRSVVIPGVTDGFTSATPVRGAVQPGVTWQSGHDFDNAANINPTFKLNNIPYKQLLINAGFPTGDLTGWTTTNTPEIVEHNGWDFRASGLIRDGVYGVALNEGDGISQTVTGLKPNTTYDVSVWGKVLGKRVAATTLAAGSDPVTPVKYRSMNGYMIPGTKTTLKFTGVDFGAALYDKVYFGTVAASGTGKIEMYIGDPLNGGTLVATDPLSDDATSGQKGQWHYRNAIALANVTGVQDVYLVFSNTNTTVPLNCYFADFTLFDSTVNPVTDYIELGASGLTSGAVTSMITTTTFTKGTASRPSNFSFTTGPSDTSVTIYAKKSGGGGLTGYVDEFGLAENSTPAPVYQSLNAFEGFENGLDNWVVVPGKGTPSTSTAVKHSGSNSFIVNEDMDAIQQIFNTSYNKIVTMWFYDNASATNMQVAGFVDDNVSARAIEVNTPTSSTKYAIRLDGTHTATNVTRTTGWHEFKWDYTSGTKVDMYIDGKLVASPTGVTSFKRIILGDQWSGNTNTVYFDDISIKDANIKPVAVSTELTTPQTSMFSGTLSASDANGDPLTYSIVSNGTKGTAVVTNPSTGEFTYTPNPDVIGTDTFSFIVNDGVVNSDVSTVTVRILDITSPVTTDDAQSGWHQAAQTIQLTATDVSSGVTQTFFSLNGSSFAEGNTVQIDEEGLNELTYYSIDAAGNQETQKSTIIKIDRTAPVITAAVYAVQPGGQNGWYVDEVTVSLTAEDHLSGVAAIEYSVDGGANWQDYQAPVTINQDGSYIIMFRSVDNAGNVETARSISFNLDAHTPSVTISSPIDGNSYSDSGDLRLQLTVTDDISGVDNSKTTVTLDGQTLQHGTTIPLYSLALGSHTITVTSSDLAGNTHQETVTFQTITTIDSLKALVTRFSDNNWIDNGGIANSLQKELEKGNLESFINEVQAQSGKHISSEAAAYLLRDASFLQNSLN
ncbi:OmpL47-type beta-barrel domain-containing protein [Paenibacillus sp. Root444D2]|uniref:OmpL47-type beta-barrel domain-containing protein n=1 Tax=Paenibacillus sp. Root444D2 TaxID=1736538 RepID=UPI00070EE647|nr:right-handed parallel beta-helix repeat-containing protein [Paenibacillus sp. Root444D2]KQX46764.1 hypothetical protein ASD40_15850 [Paenibacillus sp. Root444D2]